MKNRISFSNKLAALTLISCLSAALSPISAALAAPPLTILASVSSMGADAYGYSIEPALSAKRRFVAFSSDASNLVEGDNNDSWDIFVHNLKTGVTQRVSVDSSGAEGNAHSFDPSISADGRFVTFWSDASNLVANDNNGTSDIFVRDLKTGVTKCVSLDSTGGATGNDHSQLPAISANGRFVAFNSAATNLIAGVSTLAQHVFVRDLKTGVTKLVSVDSNGVEGNNGSFGPVISADGRFVAFTSYASSLVEGDTNGVSYDGNGLDVFLHDLKTGVTQRVSVDSSGAEGDGPSQRPSISADGRFVAFDSVATNWGPMGSYLPGDVYVRDLKTGVTKLVSLDSVSGDGSYPSLSANGRFVAYVSNGNPSNLYVQNLKTGVTQFQTTVYITDSNGNTYYFKPALSATGRFVAFQSGGSIFVRRQW